MIWKDAKDEEIAKRLQPKIDDRRSAESANLKRTNEKVEKIKNEITEKGSSKKIEKKLEDAKNNVSNIESVISNLNSSSAELKEMGSKDVSPVITFNEITGQEGGTKLTGGVITMDVVGDANAIHEAVQVIKLIRVQQTLVKHIVKFQPISVNTHLIQEV